MRIPQNTDTNHGIGSRTSQFAGTTRLIRGFLNRFIDCRLLWQNDTLRITISSSNYPCTVECLTLFFYVNFSSRFPGNFQVAPGNLGSRKYARFQEILARRRLFFLKMKPISGKFSKGILFFLCRFLEDLRKFKIFFGSQEISGKNWSQKEFFGRTKKNNISYTLVLL